MANPESSAETSKNLSPLQIEYNGRILEGTNVILRQTIISGGEVLQLQDNWPFTWDFSYGHKRWDICYKVNFVDKLHKQVTRFYFLDTQAFTTDNSNVICVEESFGSGNPPISILGNYDIDHATAYIENSESPPRLVLATLSPNTDFHRKINKIPNPKRRK